MEAHYKHTQIGWVVLFALLGVGALATAILLTAQLGTVALLTGVVTIAFCLLFGTLTVTVDDQRLVAKFGIGLIRKKVDLRKVRAYAPVRTPWYYGWGIRIYPGGVLYNVSGLDSVELILEDGKRCRIGTDEPDALTGAIRKSVGNVPPLSPGELAQVRRRSRRFVIAILLVVLVVFMGIGGMMYEFTKSRWSRSSPMPW